MAIFTVAGAILGAIKAKGDISEGIEKATFGSLGGFIVDVAVACVISSVSAAEVTKQDVQTLTLPQYETKVGSLQELMKKDKLMDKNIDRALEEGKALKETLRNLKKQER